MSIPKEPRQLMINLMYLVLTAMLALNVSAEIFNAFKIVNDGLVKSNGALDEANGKIPDQVAQLSKKKAELQRYADLSKEVRAYSKDASDYIQSIFDNIVDEAGDNDGTPYSEGDYKMDQGKKKYKGIKDKDVTTRILLDQGAGEELKAKLVEAKAKFLSFVDEEDRASVEANIPISIDDAEWQAAKKVSWSDFNFKQMPLGAVEPMFTKWVNDIKNSEAVVLNEFMSKVGGKEVVFDQYKVVSSPKRTYVIKGEKFETDVFLSASASKASNTGVSIKVNGKTMPAKEGVAKFSETASSTGVKKYTAAITVTNPVTGEVKTVKNDFEYEVGLRSVAVSLDKMNVFYIGVDNPVSVSAAGVATKDLKVNASGGGLKLSSTGNGKFNARVTTPGSSKITVSGGGLQPTVFDYKVKRIPDPVVKLGKFKGGKIGNGSFKAMPGLIPWLENFDFDAKCKVQGFNVTRIAKRADPVVGTNAGPTFKGKVANMIKAARPGDAYLFEDVKVTCPGDKAGREVNSLSFQIK
ncbi:MAG: hypothetical protein KJP00_14725 [Bacteroidia bacterium]|nr:hypothetical protein [Bacteroidia bacterium]